MSSMVERVARAIYEAWAKEEGSDVTWEEIVMASGDDEFPNIQKWHRMAFAEARAAIEAMREPDQRMKIAGVKKYVELTGKARPVANEQSYKAMIDAALSEPSP